MPSVRCGDEQFLPSWSEKYKQQTIVLFTRVLASPGTVSRDLMSTVQQDLRLGLQMSLIASVPSEVPSQHQKCEGRLDSKNRFWSASEADQFVSC